MIYNWKIIGHEDTLELLERDITSGNLAHAYLFAGPNQLGKFTVATQMANILQCTNNFCHECKTCVQIQKGLHTDTLFSPYDGEAVKVEFVRDLIARVNMTTQSPYTVVLIEAIERMTPEAANAFLKTLEEPPDRVIFLLTTENIKMVMPTVLSRTRVINFKICGERALIERLKADFPEADSQTLEQVALLSLGKPGKAINFLRDLESLNYYQSLYSEANLLLEEKGITRKFAYVENLMGKEKAFMVEDFLDIMEHVLRSRLLKSAGGQELDADQKTKIMDGVAAVLQAREQIDRNINARLALENLLISI